MIAFGVVFLLIQTDAMAENDFWWGAKATDDTNLLKARTIYRSGSVGIATRRPPENFRLRVDDGRVLFGGDKTMEPRSAWYRGALEVRGRDNGHYVADFTHPGGSGLGVRIAVAYPHTKKNIPALAIGSYDMDPKFIFYNNGRTHGVSDERLKSDIRPLQNTLSKIDKIRGVTFKWNESEGTQVGLIAQDVEKVFPELVSENEGYKGIDYMRFAAVLVEGVKELKEEVAGLRAKNEMLLKRIEELDKGK